MRRIAPAAGTSDIQCILLQTKTTRSMNTALGGFLEVVPVKDEPAGGQQAEHQAAGRCITFEARPYVADQPYGQGQGQRGNNVRPPVSHHVLMNEKAPAVEPADAS